MYKSVEIISFLHYTFPENHFMMNALPCDTVQYASAFEANNLCLLVGHLNRNWLGYLHNYIVEFNHWRIRQEFSNPWLECLYQADKHNKKVFYCFCKNRIELKNRKMGIKGSLLSLLLTLTTLVEIIIIWVLQFLSFYFLNLNRDCYLICRPDLFFRVNSGCKFYA